MISNFLCKLNNYLCSVVGTCRVILSRVHRPFVKGGQRLQWRLRHFKQKDNERVLHSGHSLKLRLKAKKNYLFFEIKYLRSIIK